MPVKNRKKSREEAEVHRACIIPDGGLSLLPLYRRGTDLLSSDLPVLNECTIALFSFADP